MTEHFEELDWLGFVLNCCPGDTARLIQEHLARECGECLRQRSYWEALRATMNREMEAPAWAVDRVMALPRQAAAPVRREQSRLVFDNMSAPLPAYLRSMGGCSRHCVYSLSDSASVEVLVERVSRMHGWSLVGQILDENGRGWDECRVQLSDEREYWQETSTNAAGEFAFTHAGQGANLKLELEAGECRWEITPVLMP